MNTQRIEHLIGFFETLRPETLAHLEGHFAEQARFRDPFNDVRGSTAIRRVFEHMFETCETPRFEVDEWVADDRLAYLRWRFSFEAGATRKTIEGVSRVVFGDDGRVVDHRDFWDPAQQLYERIPILGRLMRALRRHLAADQTDTFASISAHRQRHTT